MAWIKMVPDDEADDEVRAAYDRYRAPHGDVDHIIKIHSVNPKSMHYHYDLYRHTMRGKSGLSRAQREMIAVVVSAVNDCHYWVTHHAEGLSRLIKNAELVDALKKDYRRASLDARDTKMLDYAAKLTREPCACTEGDVRGLRGVGFTDADIHDIVQTIAYYAFVNRTACGLGVELEDYWGKD